MISETPPDGTRRRTWLEATIVWALRALLCIGGVWLLWIADDKTVERWANVATIAVPIVTFYFVTFEPEIVGWIIRRIRNALNRQKSKTEPKAAGLKPHTADLQHKASSSGLPENTTRQTAANESKTGTEEAGNAPAKNRLLPLALAIGLLFGAAIAIGRPYQPRASSIAGLPPSPETGASVVEEVTPPEAGNASREENAELLLGQAITVEPGDTCYGIAASCTGDGERFVELGPPANPTLDVSDRDLCLIRPGDVLAIPTAWPSECIR